MNSSITSNKFYVYEIWDPINNEPFYVGKGYYKKRYLRYLDHIKEALGIKNYNGKNYHKRNRIKKILNQNKYPIIKIVFESENEQEVFNKEKELIKIYGRRDLKTGSLTNLTEGGEGSSGYIFTAEARQKISKRVSGTGNPMYGKNHTLETKKIISECRKNYPVYHHTEKWKSYLRSPESYLIKLNIIKSKSIYQIDFNGNVIKIWSSEGEAARFLNINKSNISSCAKHKYRSYMNFYWLFEKDAKIKDNKLLNIEKLNIRRLKEQASKSIIQQDLKGNIIKIWKSALQIKRTLGFSNSVISYIITGKRKTNEYKGSLWLKYS